MDASHWNKMIYKKIATKTAATLLALAVARETHAFAPPEPVEQIRAALKAYEAQPADRDRNLRLLAARLETLQEVRLALELSEWTSPEAGGPNARIDGQVRALLVERLAEGYREVLVGKDNSAKGRLLTTLSDCSKDRITGRGVLEACATLVEELGTIAKGPEPEQGVHAIEILSRVPVPPSGVAGLLEKSLLPDSPLRRLAVADAVGAIVSREIQHPNGPNQAPGRSLDQIVSLMPLVQKLTADEQVRVRRSSLIACQKLAQLALNTANNRTPQPAGESAAGSGENQASTKALLQSLTPRIVVCLRDPDTESRRKAQDCLVEILRTREALLNQGISGSDPLASLLPGCLATLGEALRDPDAKVRRTSLESLEILGPGASSCGPTIAQSLEDPDPFVRWGAIRAITAMGPSAPSQAKNLIRARLEDADQDVRDAAESALRRLRD